MGSLLVCAHSTSHKQLLCIIAGTGRSQKHQVVGFFHLRHVQELVNLFPGYQALESKVEIVHGLYKRETRSFHPTVFGFSLVICHLSLQ